MYIVKIKVRRIKFRIVLITINNMFASDLTVKLQDNYLLDKNAD